MAVIAIVFFPEGFIRCIIDRTERRLMYQHKTLFTDDLHGFFSAQQTACSFRRKDFLILPNHAHDITIIAFIGPGHPCLNPILDYCHSYRLSPLPSITPLSLRSASLIRFSHPTSFNFQPITWISPANCHKMSPASFLNS